MDPAAFLKNTAGDVRNLCNFGGGQSGRKGQANQIEAPDPSVTPS
jgi:hypothetical protein